VAQDLSDVGILPDIGVTCLFSGIEFDRDHLTVLYAVSLLTLKPVSWAAMELRQGLCKCHLSREETKCISDKCHATRGKGGEAKAASKIRKGFVFSRCSAM
jgi:hypothetical protein